MSKLEIGILSANADEILSDVNRHFVERKILDVFEECGFDKHRASLPPEHEHYIGLRAQKPNPMPDRKRIDDIAFNALNLTLDERDEIYWCLGESVLSRLQKASSV